MTSQEPLAYVTGPVEPPGLRRIKRLSLMIHVGAVLTLFLVPREWLSTTKTTPHVMTISLGAAGPRTAGMNPTSSRPIEEVAPPPKRPEPARPATPKTEPPPVAAIKTPKPPPKPAPADPKPGPTTPPRPPITGPEVKQGTSRAETGATTQGTGLAGGQGLGVSGDISSPDFCCPEYVGEMQRRINDRWRRDQPEVGVVVLTFVIQRDGKVTELKTERSPSSLLEYHARNAFNGLLLPALPLEYKDQVLKVRLTFNYVR
jgi:outer membrane biosynthesis protein TonB